MQLGINFPQIYAEARHLKMTVPVLPEAEGWEGLVDGGFATTRRTLFVGESTMAGVGVGHHRQGFAGSFCSALSKRLEVNAYWSVVARSGFTLRKINRLLVPRLPAQHFDLIVLGVGANDAFKLSSIWRWRYELRKLIEVLQAKYSRVPLVFTNTPPISEFPVFSDRMKDVIGGLATIFSEELVQIAEEYPDVYFMSEKILLSEWQQRTQVHGVESYFSDGIHPSEFTYQIWAENTVDFARNNLLI